MCQKIKNTQEFKKKTQQSHVCRTHVPCGKTVHGGESLDSIDSFFYEKKIF